LNSSLQTNLTKVSGQLQAMPVDVYELFGRLNRLDPFALRSRIIRWFGCGFAFLKPIEQPEVSSNSNIKLGTGAAKSLRAANSPKECGQSGTESVGRSKVLTVQVVKYK
jgi:hypothetical protein